MSNESESTKMSVWDKVGFGDENDPTIRVEHRHGFTIWLDGCEWNACREEAWDAAVERSANLDALEDAGDNYDAFWEQIDGPTLSTADLGPKGEDLDLLKAIAAVRDDWALADKFVASFERFVEV